MASKQVKKKIKARIGENLTSVLSKTLVKDWYTAVSEFVCNSYDADSENVHVDIDTGLETLVIKDDGNGMNEKGLRNFFRLGDSSKIKKPISPRKRRRRIGKYGIAKVLLRYLGDSHKIKSVQNGILYCVDEGAVDGNIEGYKHKVSKDIKNGTTITISDLRFKIGNRSGEFDIKRLQKRLQWDIPNKPDFDVFVNKQLVKKRGMVEYARVYRVNEKIGNDVLKGRIYWRKGGHRDLEGIRIYVNGRTVGDPSMFDLKKISWSFEGRTQGEIHADFLEDMITLDRSDFQECPKLDAVKSAVNRILGNIREDISEGRGKRAFDKDKKINQNVQGAIGLAEEVLNNRLESNKYYVLELGLSDKSGPISRLDKETNIIYLNPENRMFAFLNKGKRLIDRKISEVYLKRAFLISAAYALTNNSVGEEKLGKLIEEQAALLFKGSRGIFESVSRFMGSRTLTPLKDIYFNKYRLYDHRELSHLTGRPGYVIRSLHVSGALKGSREHLFNGPSIIKSLKPLEKYVSCIEVVDERFQNEILDKGEGMPRIIYDNPKANLLDIALANLEDKRGIEKLEVINVGKKYPLHFVPKENLVEFVKYVNKNKLYDGN